MPNNNPIFGSDLFANLAQDVGLVLFDVGSRGGIFNDFLPAASSTSAIGFEPDTQECDRLNSAAKNPSSAWKSEIHYPVALGSQTDNLDLHICHQPGCSSTLEPDPMLALEYGRETDFKVTEQIPLTVEPLDQFCKDKKITDVDFLKVDVQGGELAVLQGGQSILSKHLLGLRVEVEFAPLYKQQPLFSEMEIYLREQGFYPADWLYQRSWRHNQKQEHAQYTRGPIPYSRGRLIHSDVLFLRDHRWILENMPDADLKLCRLAIIALLYHQVDLAAKLLACVKDNKIVTAAGQEHWSQELDKVSRNLYRIARKEKFASWKQQLGRFIKG